MLIFLGGFGLPGFVVTNSGSDQTDGPAGDIAWKNG